MSESYTSTGIARHECGQAMGRASVDGTTPGREIQPSEIRSRHHTCILPYNVRADLPSTAPLASYLFRLMALKKSNLCVSADVTTTAEVLQLAEAIGDHICLLKTHLDALKDFNIRTVKSLREIARRRGFVVFEDRRFGDVGTGLGPSHKQCLEGMSSVVQWAELTSAHIFPTPAIVGALREAASHSHCVDLLGIHTEISAGSSESLSPDSDAISIHHSVKGLPLPGEQHISHGDRAHSMVSVSTTISYTTEASTSPALSSLSSSCQGKITSELGPPPRRRGLLLLAEPSSERSLVTPEYSEQCVKTARQNRDFVVGFVSEQSLNQDPEDNFISLSPVAEIPHSSERFGDGHGLAQQNKSFWDAVVGNGVDIVTVGGSVFGSGDGTKVARKYQQAAWAAYEERLITQRTREDFLL